MGTSESLFSRLSWQLVVYDKIGRVLKATLEVALFLGAQAQSQRVPFARTAHHQYASSRLFPPVSHAPALRLDPLLPGPRQRRGLVQARAARVAGRPLDGLPGAHDRDLDPEGETSLDEVLATLELPAGRFQAQLGTGRAAEVIDLGGNDVRVTVMPPASSRAELPVPRAIRSGRSDFSRGSQSQCTPFFSV